MKRSDKFWLIVCLLVNIFCGYLATKKYKQYVENSKTDLYIGTVISKNMEDHFNKHGGYSSTNRILIVNFDKLGIKDVRPTISVFYNTKIDQRIAFYFTKEELEHDNGKITLSTIKDVFKFMLLLFIGVIDCIFIAYYTYKIIAWIIVWIDAKLDE